MVGGAVFAADAGGGCQPKALCIAGEDLPLVVQLDLLGELGMWELDEGCLWAPIVVALCVLVLNHLHSAMEEARNYTNADCGCG